MYEEKLGEIWKQADGETTILITHGRIKIEKNLTKFIVSIFININIA